MNDDDFRDACTILALPALIQAYAIMGHALDMEELCSGALQYGAKIAELRNKEPEEEEGIVAIKKRIRRKT
jgi:hypothetical protein